MNKRIIASRLQVVLAKNDQTNFVVILGCSSCLLQCLVSMLVLTAFWWRNRTWLNFLKIQCCVAVIAAMATFIYAVHIEIAEVLDESFNSHILFPVLSACIFLFSLLISNDNLLLSIRLLAFWLVRQYTVPKLFTL